MENFKFEKKILEDLTATKIQIANVNFEKSMAAAITEYAKQTGNLPNVEMGKDGEGSFGVVVTGFLK